jgi:hypothetical protein
VAFSIWAIQMTQYVIANNVNTQLAAAAASGATTLTLASSANLPTLSAGQVMPLTLNDAATGNLYEVVYVTAISGVTLTVTRAQEGTGALNWSLGDYAYCAPTAGTVATALGNPNNVFAVAPATASQHAVQFGQAVGRLLNVQVFTSSGTYTPFSSLVTSIIVKAVGGGGGSGGNPVQGAGSGAFSVAGSGASYAEVRYTSGFSGATVTVGAAGTAGTSTTNGGTGGTSSFVGTGISMSCPGGNGGSFGGGATGFTAVGGAASPAAATVTGGTTIANIRGSAGGGGFNAASGGASVSGSGGSSALGIGAPSTGSTGSYFGSSGTGYGAGASSAYTGASGGATTGGAGTIGIVIIYEYA